MDIREQEGHAQAVLTGVDENQQHGRTKELQVPELIHAVVTDMNNEDDNTIESLLKHPSHSALQFEAPQASVDNYAV